MRQYIRRGVFLEDCPFQEAYLSLSVGEPFFVQGGDDKAKNSHKHKQLCRTGVFLPIAEGGIL